MGQILRGDQGAFPPHRLTCAFAFVRSFAADGVHIRLRNVIASDSVAISEATGTMMSGDPAAMSGNEALSTPFAWHDVYYFSLDRKVTKDQVGNKASLPHRAFALQNKCATATSRRGGLNFASA